MTRQAAEHADAARDDAAWGCGPRLAIMAKRARSRRRGRLVARRGDTLAFVEVKQRATADAASWSLDAYRLRRVAVAAEQLAIRYLRPGDVMRIDALYLVPGRLPRHLPNVWTG